MYHRLAILSTVQHFAIVYSARPLMHSLPKSTCQGVLGQKKLMVMLCLGPVRGTLELQPYDEDAEAHEIPTVPGALSFLSELSFRNAVCVAQLQLG